MRSRVFLSAAAVAAASACCAAAAPIGVTTGFVGGGDAPVPHCDADGFTYSYTTSRGNVTAVLVGSVADPACEGGSVSLTLTNSAGARIASGGPQVVPTDGDGVDNSVTVSTNPQPAASQVAGIHVYVEGP